MELFKWREIANRLERMMKGWLGLNDRKIRIEHPTTSVLSPPLPSYLLHPGSFDYIVLVTERSF